MLRRPISNLLYRLAHLMFAFGTWGAGLAARLFRLSIAVWPDHPRAGAWLKYVEALEMMRQGDLAAAIALLKQAVAALPSVVAIRGNLGIAYALEGAYDDAIYNLEAVFKEGWRLARAGDLWAALVWSYLRSGRLPKAKDTCERAAEHNVDTPRLLLLSAIVAGVQDGALPKQEISRLLRVTPTSAPLVLEYAQYLAATDKRQLACQLIESLPSDSWGRGYRVVAYSALNAGDIRTASWAAACCEETADDAAAAAMLRSEIALSQRDAEQALSHARRALASTGNAAAAHEQLGKALLLRGNWAGAVAQMIEALHTGKGSALAAGLAALASINAGDFVTARGLFAGRRTGDGLGVACAHVAQCRIMQHADNCEEALKLAGWALDEIEELPDWLALEPLVDRLTDELNFALGQISSAGNSSEFADLQDRVARIRARRLSASP